MGEYFDRGLIINKSAFGKGVFATRLIKAGELLVVERPLLSSSTNNPLILKNILFKDWRGSTIIQKFKDDGFRMSYLSEEFALKFGKLRSNLEVDDKKNNQQKGTFERYFESAIEANCYSIMQLSDNPFIKGLKD